MPDKSYAIQLALEVRAIERGLYPVSVTESGLDDTLVKLEDFLVAVEAFAEETKSAIESLRTQLIEGGNY